MRLIIEPNYEQLSKMGCQLCSSEDQKPRIQPLKNHSYWACLPDLLRWVCTRT